MIAALPLSYLVLKLGGPAYSVFIVVFAVNFTQMFITWYLIHSYALYSYKELLRRVYWPCGIVTVLGIVFPFTIIYLMKDGWIRFFLILIGSILINVIIIGLVGLTAAERHKIKSIVQQKIHQ